MKASLAGVAAILAVALLGSAAAAQEQPADVCLEVAPSALSADEWSAVTESAAAAVEPRTALFPEPTTESSEARLSIHSGHGEVDGEGSCLRDGYEWSARFGRAFLEAGADRMLAEAPTTPGVDSDVTIEWYPDEARLRTTLVFAGPFDIPNGTCWVDDALTVDAATGVVVSSGEQGVETSPFAESACGRFFDNLPEGGAGEQAATLLPSTIELPDGSMLRLVAQDVTVTENGIVVSGDLARD